MIKINLDRFSINEIFKLIIKNIDNKIVFYNSEKGNNLNKNIIFSILLFIKKLNKNIDYYFYNVPFCLFKNLGRNFIDKHCIRNRLCNYYNGYITYNKCNKCRYGLFCNNFNKNIDKSEIKGLEGFYTNTFSKDDILEKLSKIKLYFLGLGYKEEEITFYITQKYIYDFLIGNINEISKEFLNYLIVYVLVDNNSISEKHFVDISSGIMVFKDKNLINSSGNFLKELGFSVNIVNDTSSLKNIFNINYKGNYLKIDKYFSLDKYLGKKPFFDFTENELQSNNNFIEFKGKIFNKKDIFIKTKVKIIKNSNDFIKSNSNIYIGKDILGGIGINNYEGILLTTDNLGNKGRFESSLKSIKIPVIYDIKPDLTIYLKDGDDILINCSTGIIKKI